MDCTPSSDSAAAATTTTTTKSTTTRHPWPWHKSLDSQEFGFTSFLTESLDDVAPADELFFKGQLLPLQLDPRLHLVQALSCQPSPTHDSASSCSCFRDDELKFTSCRITQNKIVSAADLRSSSFRSQNSGYWESGGDKDVGDSSSCSRDSNGSSQDSYNPNSTTSSYTTNLPQAKTGFLLWRSLLSGLRRATKKQSNKISFSEDLSRYAKVSRDGGSMREPVKVCVTSTGASCSKPKAKSNKPKPKSVELKEKWQGYARKLKPLSDVKKGLMGQFRIDECGGKNACAVESGTILRPPMQRRLSHQASPYKNRGAAAAIAVQVSDDHIYSSLSGNLLAMSSCPPSSRSSPNHSGVLVSRPKSSVGFNTSHTHNHHNRIGNAAETVDACGSNYTSMSTMQELHSAVQSAIAHCKESNKKQVTS